MNISQIDINSIHELCDIDPSITVDEIGMLCDELKSRSRISQEITEELIEALRSDDLDAYIS